MKNLAKNLQYIIIVIFSLAFLNSCTKNEESVYFYTTKISGKVIREVTNQPISGITLYLEIVKIHGSGYASYKETIDVRNVITDQSGKFEVSLRNSTNTYLIIRKELDDIYGAYGGGQNFASDQNYTSIDLTVKLQKFINCKKCLITIQSENLLYSYSLERFANS